MKILIVDDDQEIIETLVMFFKSLNHQTVTALTAAEGMKQAVTSEPDLVFLDIRLPDKDGINVLKDLKQVNKNLPVVMITGYKEAEKVIEAFRYGALDCLLKPFNFDYIKNLLPQIRVKSN
jgi:DNA-binding NtrC family response regulator